MDRSEKAQELLEQAKKLGLRVEFDSGLIEVFVKQTVWGDRERKSAIIAELGKHLVEVRRRVERRAMAARANGFVGQRIWSADGEGVLAGASGDGALTITIVREGFRHPQTVTAKAEGLLIILDEEAADGASSPADQKPELELPRKRLFGLI